MRASAGLLLLVLAGAQCAVAAEMRSIDVVYDDGHYSLVSVAWFDAGLDETFDVFSTWDYSPQFSGAIVEARDLEPDEDGRPGYFIINKGCVLFFCRSMTRQGFVERQHNLELRAIADPAVSDFHHFEEHWAFTEEDGGTSVRYELSMVPDFWVPPAIGPYVIKRKLRKDGGRALDRMEALAQSLAESMGPPVD
ncbi:MAG: hypothetical protein OEY37_08895 [Gammaproteobacteria bacterium]|nr:hypothetical protein [Gammaproteobacteria bacterium]MDH5620325.1 hypothetical protein [Gammaproteobacteria bacterium]